MKDFINHALRKHYNLKVYEAIEVPGGWSASAFIAHTDNGRFFVKVYDKHRPSIQPWITHMEQYMPAVLWLHENTPLREHMIAPMLTLNDNYNSENHSYVLLVFPFVDGITVGEEKLSSEQTNQLAKILAVLHTYGEDIPVPTHQLKETYALPFLDAFRKILTAKNTPLKLQAVLKTHRNEIYELMEEVCRLANGMCSSNLQYALCHTDVHGWNLMWTNGRLILIDWEGLRLAPVESDLFSFSKGFFFDYAGGDFFVAYQQMRTSFTLHKAAMRFYRLRRRLEDIAEFSISIANDNLSAKETEHSLKHLQRELTQLRSE